MSKSAKGKKYNKEVEKINLQILGVSHVDDENDWRITKKGYKSVVEFNEGQHIDAMAPWREKFILEHRKRIGRELAILKRHHKKGAMLAAIADRILKQEKRNKK